MENDRGTTTLDPNGSTQYPAQDANSSSSTKRRREARERVRVSRACDRCKSKKTRCTGRHPCILCVKLGLACTFNASYTRGRLPSVISDIGLLDEQAVQNQGHSSFPIVDHAQSDCVPNVEPMSYPSPASVEQARSNRANYLEPQKQRLSSGGPSSRTSPEPEASQTDRQGHYVGPASGVSFLLRLQKKLVLQKTTSSSNSSIFTFGDASLPEFDPHFFILPAKNEAQHMVARYFDFAVPTHRFLHRPTIETWLEEFYDNVGVMKQKDGAHERIAMLFMIFAMAKEYMSIPSADSADISARYFQAAEQQLNAARGEIQLTSVQTRLCQCFYLLAQSRINHCWSLFGTTTHLAYAIGIHRRRRVDSTTDLVDLECRKRVFWCAYSLDNYLSTALGRPRTFHDDDIDQDLPTCVNDTELTPERILPRPSTAQSVMLAPVAHATLSQIVSLILRDLYPIRRVSLAKRVTLTAKYSGKLESWRSQLPRFLDDGLEISLMLPLFQRQRNVLNLSYWHAMILVHRPFLLSNFASLTNRSGNSEKEAASSETTANVERCLNAAINVTAIVNDLYDGKQIYRAFWFTHYFAFCAIVVLYVYTIQQHTAQDERYRRYFDAAAKCQSQITAMAQQASLAQRYGVVLEELRLEAIKQTRNIGHNMASTQPNWQRNIDTVLGHLPNHANDEGNILGTEQGHSGFDSTSNGGFDSHNATPTSLLADLTSWGNFDSLVMAGNTDLDSIFMSSSGPSWDLDLNTGMEAMI